MAKLTEMFGFEQRVFSLGDEIFCPLKNAIQRWPVQVPAAFSCNGPTHLVLYELSGCRFVLFEYHLCERWTVGRWWRNREIWVGSDPPKYRELTPDRAVEFLWDYHCELPKSLEHWPEKMLREKASPPERPRPSLRPLSLWSGTRTLGLHNQPLPDDVLKYVDKLIKTGVSTVQALRKLDSENTQVPMAMEFFMAMLMATFKVDPATWKCSVDVIPPESVTMLELNWPAKTHQIQEPIPKLIELLEPPVVVLKGFRPSRHAEEPTWEEQKVASSALRDAIPDMEAHIVSMRKRLAEIRQDEEQEAKAQAERLAVPRPTETEFILYQIHVTTGMKQSQVAQEYTQRMGLPMEQGRVSKAVWRVREWVEAGNVAPVTALPDPRKAVSIDPKVLDRGPRQDGQTPAQRGKGDLE